MHIYLVLFDICNTIPICRMQGQNSSKPNAKMKYARGRRRGYGKWLKNLVGLFQFLMHFSVYLKLIQPKTEKLIYFEFSNKHHFSFRNTSSFSRTTKLVWTGKKLFEKTLFIPISSNFLKFFLEQFYLLQSSSLLNVFFCFNNTICSLICFQILSLFLINFILDWFIFYT